MSGTALLLTCRKRRGPNWFMKWENRMHSVQPRLSERLISNRFSLSLEAPQSGDFQDAHPEIDVQVLTETALVDFSRDGVDAAVRRGFGRYPGLRSERLFAIELIPVAAPGLATRLATPRTPADLTRWPHVHDADRKDWHLWFRAQGIDDIGPPSGRRISTIPASNRANGSSSRPSISSDFPHRLTEARLIALTVD